MIEIPSCSPSQIYSPLSSNNAIWQFGSLLIVLKLTQKSLSSLISWNLTSSGFGIKSLTAKVNAHKEYTASCSGVGIKESLCSNSIFEPLPKKALTFYSI